MSKAQDKIQKNVIEFDKISILDQTNSQKSQNINEKYSDDTDNIKA